MTSYRQAVLNFSLAENQFGYGKTLISADVHCLNKGLEMTTNIVCRALEKMREDCKDIVMFCKWSNAGTVFRTPVYKGDE